MTKPPPKIEADTQLMQKLKAQVAEWYDYNILLGLQPGKVKGVPLKDDMQARIDLDGPYDIGATRSFSSVVISKLTDGDFTVFAVPKGSDKIHEISITRDEMNASEAKDIFSARTHLNAMRPRTEIESPPLTHVESADQLAYMIMEARLHRKKGAPNLIIDIGHLGNGKDVGADGNGLNEPTVNLPIAAAIMRKAMADGINVYFTAEDLCGKEIFNRSFKDALLTPKTRNVMIEDFTKAHANEKNLAVSLHANSLDNKSVKGFEVFYESGDIGSAVLAYTTMHNLGKSYEPHNGDGGEMGVYSTDFRARAKEFLRGPNSCPKIMTEVGYLSSPEQAAVLKTLGAADLCASHIYEAAAKNMDVLSTKRKAEIFTEAEASIEEFVKNLDFNAIGAKIKEHLEGALILPQLFKRSDTQAQK